jgi:hypothetical protein
MHFSKSLAAAACGLVLLSMFLVGCDGRPKRVPLSGRVLIDGKPLTTGFVRLYPENGRSASSEIDANGRFTLTTFDTNDGCILGKHPLTVTSSQQKSANSVLWLAPKKYSQVSTSGLILDVTGANENAEINLTWDGGKPYIEVVIGAETGDEGARFRKKKYFK